LHRGSQWLRELREQGKTLIQRYTLRTYMSSIKLLYLKVRYQQIMVGFGAYKGQDWKHVLRSQLKLFKCDPRARYHDQGNEEIIKN
jgi:hypothetical protein